MRVEKRFAPTTIILETEEELAKLLKWIGMARRTREGKWHMCGSDNRATKEEQEMDYFMEKLSK